jgi:hypothetical protein
LVKTGRKYRTLYLKTKVDFVDGGETNPPQKHFYTRLTVERVRKIADIDY